MYQSISAVITAAGKNRRMREDLKKKNLPMQNKLLMDLQGTPVICHTIQQVLKADVDECIVVVGHFKEQITPLLDDLNDDRIKVIENDPADVPLSSSLLNGVDIAEGDVVLCAAADQPSVESTTFKRLIDSVISYESPENILSVLSRGKTGFLDSAQGLGMPLVCGKGLLQKYLPDGNSNLNPILRKMIDEGVIFYAIAPENELELVNINRYDDFLLLNTEMKRD